MAQKKFDIYAFLTHAIWHCQWGSEREDREPDNADLQAAKILTDLRTLVARETVTD